MQRKLRWLWKTEKGAISVFLLLIFLGMLMLAGLIVDISRVMVAERKVETALATATRSVLAEYNQELVGQYGLYGLSYTPEREADLKRYFLANLVERHPGFHFLNFELDQVKITGQVQNSILNDAAFQQQITEYMKYKGPVMITQNVVDIFLKGAFGQKADVLDSAKSTGGVLDGVRISQEKLNEKIKKAAKNAAKNAAKDAVERMLSLDELEDNLQELQAKITEYEKKLLEDNQRIEQIASATEEVIAESRAENSAEGRAENGGKKPQKFSLPPEVQKLKAQLRQQLEDLQFNRQILEEIKKQEKALDEANKRCADSVLLGNPQEIADCFQKRKELTTEIEDLNAQLRTIKELPELCSDQLPSPLAKGEKAAKEAIISQLKQLLGPEISAGNPVTQLIPAQDIQVANSQEQLSPAEQAQQMGMYAYDEKMNNWSEENAEAMGSNIFTYLKEFTSALKQLGTAGMDKMYLIEYIMDKHTFITSPTQRGHYFSKGEVEYILCGNNFERANLLEAFVTIWSLRFAINAVDSFITNPAPTFFARLGTALVEGFICATRDMGAMYTTTGAPLCDSLKASPTRLSYSDHLRLLLLLKSEKAVLDRTRQLMQINLRQSDGDFLLKNYGTRLVGTAEVKVDLWFASLLQLEKFGLKQVKGNQYLITKTAVAEY